MPQKQSSRAAGSHGKRPSKDSGIPRRWKRVIPQRSRPGAKENKSRNTTTEVKKSGESGNKTKAAPLQVVQDLRFAGGGSLYDFHKGCVSTHEILYPFLCRDCAFITHNNEGLASSTLKKAMVSNKRNVIEPAHPCMLFMILVLVETHHTYTHHAF